MGKFTGVLFACDFDHTISAMDGTIPESNIAAIREFLAGGGRFSVVSGRSVPLFRQKFSLLPINAPCILFNGAVCYDYRTEQTLFSYCMPECAQEILEGLRTRAGDVRIEVQTQEMIYAYGEDPFRDEYLHRAGVSFAYAGERPVPRPWMKIVVYGKFRRPEYDAAGSLTPEDLQKFDEVERLLRELTCGRANVARSMGRIVECWPLECDKGKSARRLAKQLDCGILVGAGDAPNDLPLLREADYAFCPADAGLGEHPFRRAAACGEGTVADVIRQLNDML